MIKYGRKKSEKLTFWLGSTGDRNGQGVDGETTDNGDENSFEEHNEFVVRK